MDIVRYRLSLAPSLEPFRTEIEYALDFVTECHPVVRSSDASRMLHYGPEAPRGAVAIPAVLFPECVRIDAQGIHPLRERLSAEAKRTEAGLAPPEGQRSAADTLPYDAIGLIFLMLSRLEERDHPARDRYGRFPAGAALFPPRNGRLAPLADRAAEDIAAALMAGPAPPVRSEFAVKLTHDVDRLKGYHRPMTPLREAAGDLLKRRDSRAAAKRLTTAYFGGEPFHSARRLMDLSERHGVTSHFYFMGPSEHPMDSPYAIRHRATLTNLAREIRRRGHAIGFHPGYLTATDAAAWTRQRSGLEALIGAPVTEGRQHVLRYDAAATPRIWSDARMTLDCTPAYPEAVGFRTGSCRAHLTYDLVARHALPLRQLSTAVMDFGLFGGKYRDLTDEEAAADTQWAIDICRRYGGTLVLLFHTGRTEPRQWAWIERTLRQATPQAAAAA